MLGSMPRSNLNEASVFKACLLAVLRMLIGLKYALSKNIEDVLSEIPEFSPPKTPAIHKGLS